MTFTVLVTVAARTNTGSVSYTDPSVAPGITYTYRVAAVNAAGPSAYSNTAVVTVPQPPAAPSNLAATAALKSGKVRVTLTWVDNATNETGFTIQRATNATFTANLVSASVGANTTTYTTGTLARSTPYYFRIQAINGAGQSTWVNATPFPIITP